MSAQDDPITTYQRLFVAQQPQRHARMLTLEETQRWADRRKYSEHSTPLTTKQLGQQLAGDATYAVPAAHAGLACLLPLDVDAGGPPALQALLDEATRRGWFAIAEYTPRPGWTDEQQRGYVSLIIGELVSATQLQLLGQELARAVVQPGWSIDARVQQAVTRLPLGRHQHTGHFAEIWLPDGTSIPATADRQAALQQIATAWHAGPLDQLPQPAVRRPAAPPVLSEAQRQADYSHKDIQRLYNEARDICDVLEAHGGRRHSSTNWHCPCGQHTHGDQSASLLIRAAKRPQYGPYIVQGFSPSCRFHSGEGQVWDSFNVEIELSGRSYGAMLTEARRYLELPGFSSRPRSGGTPPTSPETPPTPQTSPPTPEGSHHTTRRARHRPTQPPATLKASAAALRYQILSTIASSTLSPSARKVGTYLLELAGDKLWCRPSQARIAAEVPLHRRTVQRAIGDLVTATILTVRPNGTSQGGDDTNIYDFARGERSSSPPKLIKTQDLHVSPEDPRLVRGGHAGFDLFEGLSKNPQDQAIPTVLLWGDLETHAQCIPQAPAAPAMSPLSDLITEAIAAYSWDLRRVRRYLADNSDRELDPAAVKRIYEAQRAERDRAKELAELAEMKPSQLKGLLRACDYRIDRLQQEGKSPAFWVRRKAQVLAEQARRRLLAEQLAARTPAEPAGDVSEVAPVPILGNTVLPKTAHRTPSIAGVLAGLRIQPRPTVTDAAVSVPRGRARVGEAPPLQVQPRSFGGGPTDAAWLQLQRVQADWAEARGDLEKARFLRSVAGLGEFGAVAIRHVEAVVPQLVGQLAPGLVLVNPALDATAQIVLGVGGAQAVEVAASAAVEVQLIHGAGNLLLDAPHEAAGIVEQPIAAGRQLAEHGTVVQLGDGAGAPSLGGGRADVDGAGLAVDVLLTQEGDLGGAQTAGEGELCGHLGLAFERVDQAVGVVPGEPEAGRRLGCAGAQVGGNVRLGVRPPAQRPQAVLELADAGNHAPDGAASQATLFAVADVGAEIVVGDVAQLADVGVQLADALDGRDAAIAIGRAGLEAEDLAVGGPLDLGLVTGLANPHNGIEGLVDLANQRAAFTHRRPPCARQVRSLGAENRQGP
jgi:hypothetical protein